MARVPIQRYLRSLIAPPGGGDRRPALSPIGTQLKSKAWGRDPRRAASRRRAKAESEESDLGRGGGDDEAALHVVARGVDGHEEESGATLLVAQRGADQHLAVL